MDDRAVIRAEAEKAAAACGVDADQMEAAIYAAMRSFDHHSRWFWIRTWLRWQWQWLRWWWRWMKGRI